MRKICPECLEFRAADLSRCPKDATDLLEVEASEDPRIGTVVADRYLILGLLGEGGMGRVYRAWQLSTARVVALKVLIAEGKLPPEIIKRFQREARVTASLRSPHTITIHDFGQLDDGALFIIMELLHGEPLDDVLEKRGRLEPARVRRIVDQVCMSLKEAHDRGLVHRDLKPANIILDVAPDGSDFAKVLDFGIVKVVDEGAHKLTQTGATIGTLAYMSPEQIDGQGVGTHADIYALGVTMFEMLTGRLPFEEVSAVAMMFKHASAPPPHLHELVPADELERMDPVVQRCLAKQPADRFESVDALRQALAALGPLQSSGAGLGSTQAWGSPGVGSGSGTAEYGGAAQGAGLGMTRDAALGRTQDAALARTGLAPAASPMVATGLAQTGLAPAAEGAAQAAQAFRETVAAPAAKGVAPWMIAVAAVVVVLAGLGIWLGTASEAPPPSLPAETAQQPPPPAKTAPEAAPKEEAALPGSAEAAAAPAAATMEPVAVALLPATEPPAELAAEAKAEEEPALALVAQPAPTPEPTPAKVEPQPEPAKVEPQPEPAKVATAPKKSAGARVSGVSITGGMTAAAARKVVLKAQSSLRSCYAKTVGASGESVSVSLMLTAAGSVRTVSAKGASAASAFQSCATGKLKGLSFPALEAPATFAAVRFTVKP